jgi:D-glycero-D-manno-heptose 1,7-bisphosphate phosphatase
MVVSIIIVRYVFLDRDGVLNRKAPEGAYVTDWAQFAWLPGAIDAIARMNRAGLTLILVTNQRGISLGLYTEADLERIHVNLQADLAQQGARLDAIYYCPHDKNQCTCRKPAIGLFEQAMKDFPEIQPANSVVIGDSISDIEAGRRLGMKTIFIQGEPELQKPRSSEAAALADAVASSLLEAVELLETDPSPRNTAPPPYSGDNRQG